MTYVRAHIRKRQVAIDAKHALVALMIDVQLRLVAPPQVRRLGEQDIRLFGRDLASITGTFGASE